MNTMRAGCRPEEISHLIDGWRVAVYYARITRDVDYFYHYDEHGRLTDKDERRVRNGGSYTHHYSYDPQHRLTHYRLMQQGNTLTESRYAYDPQGRRVGKRVWTSLTGRDPNGDSCRGLNPGPEVTWYGWDGDRLTTTQTDTTRIQTVYQPGRFTPLARIETATKELARAIRRTLAEKLQQDAGMAFVPELVAMLDNLEAELKRGAISEQSLTWLAQCGLTVEQMKNQLEPEYTLVRKLHLYHCDHRGLPLALVNINGDIAWRAEFDEWGNVLREDNPNNLHQLIRLPGQQWDEETGLCYNRHRYYDPAQGRYITQDPIGLLGGLNPYAYALNPVMNIDPLGLLIVVKGDSTNYDAAISYLKGDPGMKDIIESLESSSTTYYIEYINDHQDRYDPTSDTIYWDPFSALACKGGGKQTPALGLGHELAHADKSWLDKLKRTVTDKLGWPNYGDYGNYEEHRVITGVETEAAKNLGEGVRTDHFGSPYHVSSPTSIL